jgi:hypothetical protein
MSVTYSECVSLSLGIQRAMRMRCSLPVVRTLYYIFLHYLINGTIF